MDVLLNFFKENKDAMTAVGVVCTFFVSALSLFFSVRNNKAVHYVNSVTKSRTEWIEKFRINISRFVAISDTQDFTEILVSPKEMFDKKFDMYIKDVSQLGEEIKLSLNFSDKFDRDLIEKIDLQIRNYRLICIKTKNNAIKSIKRKDRIYIPEDEIYELQNSMEHLNDEIIKSTQIYLKAEWNRVKYESQGKTYEKETQEFDIEELMEKYDNPEYKNNVIKRICINFKAKVKRIRSSYVVSVPLFLIGIIILVYTIQRIVQEILIYVF